MNRRWAMMFLLAVAVDAYPCTTFCMTVDGRVVFGANYDWDVRNGMIMVNKRSVSRQSLTQRPANWISTYASITFNQYGRDFPTGGMNEAGLVVALMDLAETEYPAVDSRRRRECWTGFNISSIFPPTSIRPSPMHPRSALPPAAEDSTI